MSGISIIAKVLLLVFGLVLAASGGEEAGRTGNSNVTYLGIFFGFIVCAAVVFN